MGVTLGELKTRLSRTLKDPDGRTFTDDLQEELILSALTEVGRILPEMFTEDLAPVADQLTYQLRSNAFGVTQYDLTAEADDDIITSTAHGLQAGDAILFSDLVGGTGLDETTTFYVIDDNLDDDTFSVSETLGGTIVDITVDYSAGTWAHLGGGQAVPEIEVVRVEVWDPTQTPEAYIATVADAASAPVKGGDAGWSVWGGYLTLMAVTQSPPRCNPATAFLYVIPRESRSASTIASSSDA